MNKNTTAISEHYPFIVSTVMEYIIQRKQEDESCALIDLIQDFCIKNSIELELVGDAIANDVYFKSFIEKDCQHHNIIRMPNNKKQADW